MRPRIGTDDQNGEQVASDRHVQVHQNVDKCVGVHRGEQSCGVEEPGRADVQSCGDRRLGEYAQPWISADGSVGGSRPRQRPECKGDGCRQAHIGGTPPRRQRQPRRSRTVLPTTERSSSTGPASSPEDVVGLPRLRLYLRLDQSYVSPC